MTKSKLHKTILILLLVLTPPYFLMFTDEGTRVSDNFVLWLAGAETFEFNLQEADSGFSREQVMQVYPDLPWHCELQRSRFGSELCTASIGAFNDFPSRYVTVFYADGRLSALKIVYRPQYHEQVLGHLIASLGQPRNVADAVSGTPGAAQVLEWNAGKGMVVLPRELGPDPALEQAALLWIATRP